MAIRKLRNGRYAVEFEQGGARIFRRLHQGATKADAQAYETKLRRDLFTADQLGVQTAVPIASAIHLWLESVAAHQKDAHRAALRATTWSKLIPSKTLNQAPEVAKVAVATWTAEGDLSPATINRRLALLKAVLKWSYQQALIDHNLSGRVRMLPEGPGREVYLNRSQVAALARHAPSPSSRAAIMLAAYTGLRATELLEQATPIRNTLSVASDKSKTGKPRLVPVPAPAQKYLKALPLPLSYWQLNKEFDVARKAAGLEVRFHDLRHTAASWLINAGVDLYTVGRILGHSTPLTTQRYAHLSHASLKRAMAKLR